MKNNSRASKGLVLVLALVMLVSVAIGGTIAWLMDTSMTHTNTFIPTGLDVELDETTGDDYYIIPGVNITKDPKVTYTTDVDSYLFVAVTENHFDKLEGLLEYEIADGWTELTGVPNTNEDNRLFYRIVDVTTGTKKTDSCYVLKNNTVTVSKDITMTDMDNLTNQPNLIFTAYIIQKDGFASPEAAWAKFTTP